MTEYHFGDIITLDFPFSHQRSGKKRPALVICMDPDKDLLVARITSKPKPLQSDVTIRDWQEAGLNVPSFVRLSKLTTIELTDVLSFVGRLSDFDREQVFNLNVNFARSHK
jgi:mRNA-degrading endonuclease toxin of MazEF toxin-antitoxin module